MTDKIWSLYLKVQTLVLIGMGLAYWDAMTLETGLMPIVFCGVWSFACIAFGLGVKWANKTPDDKLDELLPDPEFKDSTRWEKKF